MSRIAFVPGGYGGIGSAIARGLALAGAKVAVAGRSADKAEAFAATLRADGHDAIGLAMDAHGVADIRSAVQRVRQHFGHLDLLVNCVGIQREQRLAEVSEQAFDEVVQVNLKAAMFLAQAAAEAQVAAITAGRAAGAAGALVVGAGPARHARPRLLGLLRHQGRVGDADQAARGGAVCTRHRRQRRGADGGARRDGQPLAGQSRRPRGPCCSASRWGAWPRPRTWSAPRCSSAAPPQPSSPGRCCISTAA